MPLPSRKPFPVFMFFLAVKCSALSPPSNGELLGCNTTEMLYNTACRFSCGERFEAKGSMVRRCTENGTWSETGLFCLGNRYCLVFTAYSTFQEVFYDKSRLFSLVFALARCWRFNPLLDWLGRSFYTRLCKYRSHTLCWLGFKPKKKKKNRKRPRACFSQTR